eukprot:scaffold208627_cov55-Prasinocladus_malaysianus.AAC.3
MSLVDYSYKTSECWELTEAEAGGKERRDLIFSANSAVFALNGVCTCVTTFQVALSLNFEASLSDPHAIFPILVSLMQKTRCHTVEEWRQLTP